MLAYFGVERTAATLGTFKKVWRRRKARFNQQKNNWLRIVAKSTIDIPKSAHVGFPLENRQCPPISHANETQKVSGNSCLPMQNLSELCHCDLNKKPATGRPRIPVTHATLQSCTSFSNPCLEFCILTPIILFHLIVH